MNVFARHDGETQRFSPHTEHTIRGNVDHGFFVGRKCLYRAQCKIPYPLVTREIGGHPVTSTHNSLLLVRPQMESQYHDLDVSWSVLNSEL